MLLPGEIETDSLKANPWLDASMISVNCRDQELLDVRVCFGRDLRPAAVRTRHAAIAG